MLHALRSLDADGLLLFATRFVRLFAYGALSIVLVFYLVGIGLSEADAGLLLTATLIGDTLVSLYLTTQADRIGRRRVLTIGTVLMVAAGVTFASTRVFWLLIVAGTIGVISPSGKEVGPFLPIEQAALSQITPPGPVPTCSPGTHSRAPSRRRSARWPPGCSPRSCSARGRRSTVIAPS